MVVVVVEILAQSGAPLTLVPAGGTALLSPPKVGPGLIPGKEAPAIPHLLFGNSSLKCKAAF